MEFPKKLIEVALPLDDINRESSREKSIRHGHPSTLHLWWARRPLAAARAVLFAQLVNDPGSYLPPEETQKERERLFDIIRKLVKWENTTNETVLEEARQEIRKSWAETCKITGEDPDKLPPFWDPFAGGGTIPLEAQRLGLEAHASDLNPVAVMINKAMIEIPPRFAGRPPVGPVPEGEEYQKGLDESKKWPGTTGLAEDVRRYGIWMRNEAYKRIGHIYPEVDLPEEHGGGKATVIAYIWARTVKSPNPAFNNKYVPLIRSFIVSNKKDEKIWIEPKISEDGSSYSFKICKGIGGPKFDGTVNRNGAVCLLSGTPIPFSYIRDESRSGRMKEKLMCIVADGKQRRLYLPPNEEIEKIADVSIPPNIPETELPEKALGFRIQSYGMLKHRDLFTYRQIKALVTFSDLIHEIRDKIIYNTEIVEWNDDSLGLNSGGKGAVAYADAITVYLAFAVDKVADYWSSICTWHSSGEKMRNTFARQAIPMAWDYAEANPFSNSTGNWMAMVDWIWKSLLNLPIKIEGNAYQQNAAAQNTKSPKKIITTDPPYYDNIGYADLSDFFYTWMRRSIRSIFPGLFSTIAVPKSEELIANPFRHTNKKEAEIFFLEGMKKTFRNIQEVSHPLYPVSIYYAFKQSETEKSGTASTGWEKFLEAVIQSGFSMTGTWPIRTEGTVRLRAQGSNVLASSIVLICRKRSKDAPIISRKQFIRELEEALPEALETMIGGKEGASPIAPVDLAQAAIGPGMAVFSKYKQVLEADGTPMSVRTALIIINKTLDEYFSHAESDMGPDTRFCVDWFQQHGFKQGPFGEADVLARAKGTGVDGLQKAGVLKAEKGKVRLLKINEYPTDWDPEKDSRIPVWEACHHLCRALRQGEAEAGRLLAAIHHNTESIRQLAYRLYTVCERKKWAEDARIYNELITSWHGITEAAGQQGRRTEEQRSLF